MANPTEPLTPEQIRRRIINYDEQVRQGLEDGDIRKVMKKLAPAIVSRKFFFSKTNH